MSIKHRILILGVGKSNIIEVLYAEGYRDIVAIDISPTVIAQMSNKYADYGGVNFYVMDARELSFFADNSFTMVMDKG